MNITLGKVLDILFEQYKHALDNETIGKPISWALYQTWKYTDQYEKWREQK